MKTPRTLLVIGLSLVTVFGAVDRPSPSNTATRDAHSHLAGGTLHFEGLLTSNTETYFVVSMKNAEGRLSARAWLKLGQTFAGHTLSQFDSQNEILSVTGTDGRVHDLRLADSKVIESEAGQTDELASIAKSMAALEGLRKGLRKKWNVPVQLTFDLDGSTMPEDVRARFLAQQEQEEAKGGYLIGVLVDGSWVFSPYRDQARGMIPPSLSNANRRKLEAAWAMLHAEGMGLGTAYENRKKGIPSKD